MTAAERAPTLSVFFPAYNDGGTIASLVIQAVKEFHDFGFRVAEVPVHHYHRAYGKSQFFNFPRLVRTAMDVARLWVALVVQRRHMHEVVVPDSLHARSSRSEGRPPAS